MGLFGFGKKAKDTTPVTPTEVATSVSRTGTEVDYTPVNGILNLTKNNILDLNKYNPSVKKVRVAAGWDVSSYGDDYDLDICAFLLDKDGRAVEKVYYADKESKGIHLDKDNVTGEGDGDDENIYVNLEKIPEKISSIVFAVVIYDARSKRQQFSKVKRAFARLVDESNGEKEICRYSLSDNGGDNTAVTFAELYRGESGWSFRTMEEYSHDSIGSLYDKYRYR